MDLDSTRGEQDMRFVLAKHRRTCQAGLGDTPVPEDEEEDAATIREWARQRDLPVSTRGRIPAEIRRQYDAYRATPGRLTVSEAVSQAEQDRQKVVRMRGRRKRQKCEGER
ncbi:histone-like nucleoid-structuring protein Lsr2 [Amycolatopsis sp. cg5]|uniref:Lsr2 family DNA-binding protein n=1 Tax=Amycolatopsis sp. cg5 TaxID=3238802 RepID=UPI003524B50C